MTVMRNNDGGNGPNLLLHMGAWGGYRISGETTGQ